MELSKNESDILNRLGKHIVNKKLSNAFLIQLIELSGGYLNLQTIPDYAKTYKLSYNGVKINIQTTWGVDLFYYICRVKVKDVTKIYDQLLKMAKYQGADGDEAQDIVQDLFIKLLEIENKEGNIDRLEWKGKINKVYMYNAIRNIAFNKRRYKAKFCKVDLERSTPEFTIHETEVKEHLKTLDPFCQKLYSAYMQDTISMRELSKKTNISVTTIFYGVKNIRNTLKGIFYDS